MFCFRLTQACKKRRKPDKQRAVEDVVSGEFKFREREAAKRGQTVDELANIQRIGYP